MSKVILGGTMGWSDDSLVVILIRKGYADKKPVDEPSSHMLQFSNGPMTYLFPLRRAHCRCCTGKVACERYGAG